MDVAGSEERRVPRRGGRTSKENLPGRKHKRVSGAKALQENLESLVFTLSLAKSKIGKRLGNEGPLKR